MDKMIVFISLMFFSLTAACQQVSFKKKGEKLDSYRNEHVEIEVSNVGNSSINGYYVPELWAGGQWTRWSWGPLDGKPNSIGTTFTLAKGKTLLFRFTLENVPQPPPAPDGRGYECDQRLKFRLRVTTSNNGKKVDIYSPPYFVFDEKNIVGGKIAYARLDCKRP